MDGHEAVTPESVRLDVWLDVACLFKTRSDAQRACRGGKVEVNGQPAKPHRLLRVGDLIRITRGTDRRQIVSVTGIVLRHIVKAEAKRMYDDRTPPPSAQELERRAFERAYPKGPSRSPDRRQRRLLRRLKGLPG
jgi:ribosome-associated heat shock protein Hsp15